MNSESSGSVAKVPVHRRLHVQVVAAIALGVVFGHSLLS
jgi:hypothetical protein